MTKNTGVTFHVRPSDTDGVWDVELEYSLDDGSTQTVYTKVDASSEQEATQKVNDMTSGPLDWNPDGAGDDSGDDPAHTGQNGGNGGGRPPPGLNPGDPAVGAGLGAGAGSGGGGAPQGGYAVSDSENPDQGQPGDPAFSGQGQGGGGGRKPSGPHGGDPH